MGLVHRARLLRAHPERLVVRTREGDPGAQLGDRNPHIGRLALHPLQIGLEEPLT